MSDNLVLSLFPGIGLLDMAFEEEGFCVVRGPDLLWGGDIKRFHPPARVFGGVIGGPPCQAFSRLRHLVAAQGRAIAPNLIPEFERCVGKAFPAWFLMENVPEAPEPLVVDYFVTVQDVVDAWVGGETRRRRRFTFGSRDRRPFVIDWPCLHRPDPEPSVMASGGAHPIPVAIGGSGKRKRTLREYETRKGAAARGDKTRAYLADALRLTGLPPDFLAHAPFTVAGKIHAIGNGVPMCMGRAVAKAVRRAIEGPSP